MSATSSPNQMTVLDGAPHARGRTVGALRKAGYTSEYIVSHMQVFDWLIQNAGEGHAVFYNSLAPEKPTIMVSYPL